MFDQRANLTHQVADEVRKHFGDQVFATVIPRNVRLSEAPSFGKPIILYDIKSKGCESYLALAKEILRREARRLEGRPEGRLSPPRPPAARAAETPHRSARHWGAVSPRSSRRRPPPAPRAPGASQASRSRRSRPTPHNPRRAFDDVPLEELAETIRTQGIIQPVLLRKEGAGYGLIAGERRWRAAQLAGLKEVPAVVRDVTPAQAFEMALVENLQREDLNPIEEAEGYKRLVDEFRSPRSRSASAWARIAPPSPMPCACSRCPAT